VPKRKPRFGDRDSKLTYDQEVVVRRFIKDSAEVDLTLPVRWLMPLYEAMGYRVAPNGARVLASIELKLPFGTRADDHWEDTFDADGENLVDSSADTSASVTPEGD